MTDLAFRPARGPADMRLVYGTWLASFRMSHSAGLIPMSMYAEVYTEAISRLLTRPGVRVTVAYHPGEEEGGADLYGWACVELGGHVPIVHYVYTIQPYRRRGLARRLLEAAGVDLGEPWEFSYRTSVVAKMAGKMGPARWAPLRARDEEREHGSDR